MSVGHIVQVIGPVVDVEFPLDEGLPDINRCIKSDKALINQRLFWKLPLNLAMA
jgi:F0F1-type ATP synthase beta subunit